MSFTLTAANDSDFRLNSWNWGVLHHLVDQAGVFPEEMWEPFRYNSGAELESDQVTALVKFLETGVLPRMKPDQRMFFDGSVTDEPDDGTFYREEGELWRNYSLHHSVLARLIGFLKESPSPITIF